MRIYRERKSFRLIPELLARELRIMGVVVFVSGRERQRGVAGEVRELVLPDIEAIGIETRSPSECMCVFDPERFTSAEVIKLAPEADIEFEKQEELSRQFPPM